MLTNRANAHPTHRLLAGALLLTFGLAACAGATVPSPSPAAPATPKPTPTAVPGEGGGSGGGSGGGTDPGTGGGSGGSGGGGNTGGGVIIPIPGLPGDPNQNPLLGQAHYLTPTPGLVQERPVNVQIVRAIVEDDGTVTADLRWWSGVAPCSQLSFVKTIKDDEAKTIEFQVVEGSGGGDVACIDIAELHAAAVDLGELASGTWTISAVGDAPAIKLDVP